MLGQKLRVIIITNYMSMNLLYIRVHSQENGQANCIIKSWREIKNFRAAINSIDSVDTKIIVLKQRKSNVIKENAREIDN